MEDDFQRRIKELHEQKGLRKRRNSDEYLSPTKNANPITPKKKNKNESGMTKFNMFHDQELREKDFKYGSPSK